MGGGERPSGLFKGIRRITETRLADRLAHLDQNGHYENMDRSQQATVKVTPVGREIDVYAPSGGRIKHTTISVCWDETYGAASLPSITGQQVAYEGEDEEEITTYSSSHPHNDLGFLDMYRAVRIAESLQAANAPKQQRTS